MSEMFCFQCQQTAGNKGCVRTGVCGKQPETADLQDTLIYELIRLAEAARLSGRRSDTARRLLIDGLFTTLTNVNFDNAAIRAFTDRVIAKRSAAMTASSWSCGKGTTTPSPCARRCCLA